MYYLLTATSDTNYPNTVYTLATDSNWYGWGYSIPSVLTERLHPFPSNQPDFATFFTGCIAANAAYTFHYVTVKSLEDLPVKFPELFI